MQLPLQITFRNMTPSEAVEARIREKAEWLEKVYGRIMGCRVMVEQRHKHHHQGSLYHIRIDLTVPGNEIVINRGSDLHHSYEDIYVAIRDSFDAARRELEEHARRLRGKVKSHEIPAHGRVRELFPEESYGNIETPDGRQIYFHKNSLVGADFARLEIGAEVRFVEAAGDLGPQASTVKVVSKHHVVG